MDVFQIIVCLTYCGTIVMAGDGPELQLNWGKAIETPSVLSDILDHEYSVEHRNVDALPVYDVLPKSAKDVEALSLKRLVEIFALNELFHQQFPEKEEPEYPNPDAKEGIELVKSTIVQFSGKSIYKILQRVTHELYGKINQSSELASEKLHKPNAGVSANELDALLTLTIAGIMNGLVMSYLPINCIDAIINHHQIHLTPKLTKKVRALQSILTNSKQKIQLENIRRFWEHAVTTTKLDARSSVSTATVSLDILKPALGELQTADLASLLVSSKKQAPVQRLGLLTPSISSLAPSPLPSLESATDATGTKARPISGLTVTTKRPSSLASRSSSSPKKEKDPNKTIYNDLKSRWELFNMVDSIPVEPSNLEYQELNYLASLMYQVAEESLPKLSREKRMDGYINVEELVPFYAYSCLARHSGRLNKENMKKLQQKEVADALRLLGKGFMKNAETFRIKDHLVTFYACELLSKLHQDGVPVEIEVQALFDGLQKNTVYPKTDKAFWVSDLNQQLIIKAHGAAKKHPGLLTEFEEKITKENLKLYQRTTGLMQKVYALRRHTFSKAFLDVIDAIFEQSNVYLPDQVAYFGLLWANIRVLCHDRPTDYLIHELIPNELLLAHQFVAHQMQAANDYENMALFNALKITDSKSNQSIYKSMDDRTKYGKEVIGIIHKNDVTDLSIMDLTHFGVSAEKQKELTDTQTYLRRLSFSKLFIDGIFSKIKNEQQALDTWIRKMIFRVVAGQLTNDQFQHEIKMFHLVVVFFNKIELQNGPLESSTLASIYILARSLEHIIESMNEENKNLTDSRMVKLILDRIKYALPNTNYLSQNIELTQRLLKLQQFLRASDQMSQIDTVWKAFVADMKRIIAESAIKYFKPELHCGLHYLFETVQRTKSDLLEALDAVNELQKFKGFCESLNLVLNGMQDENWKELFDQLTKLMENHLFNDKYGQKDSYEQKQVHGFALILSEFGDRFKLNMSPVDRLKLRVYYEIIVSDDSLSPEILAIFRANADFLQRTIPADALLHHTHAAKIAKFQLNPEECQEWQNHLTELAIMREATELSPDQFFAAFKMDHLPQKMFSTDLHMFKLCENKPNVVVRSNRFFVGFVGKTAPAAADKIEFDLIETTLKEAVKELTDDTASTEKRDKLAGLFRKYFEYLDSIPWPKDVSKLLNLFEGSEFDRVKARLILIGSHAN